MAEVLAELQDLAKDPSLIGEFLELVGRASRQIPTDVLSPLLTSTLIDLRTSEEDDQFRNHCDFDCHSEKFACFVLEDRELVVAANQIARDRFDIKASTRAEDLDFVGLDGQPFSDVVKAAMQAREPGSKETPIAQAYSPKLKRRLDVAILHLHVCALMGITKEIILICDAITPTTLELFASKFDLTPAESEVVERFSTGQSIAEIAAKRGRSVATVKTQFYKILEKCGASSQGELLQMVARVESLTAATTSINEEFSHPHRRIFHLMRPGNRTLDVVSAGKPDGRPVISCNSFGFRAFPPWMEEETYQHDLKLYSIAPPGSGNTSPPLDAQSIAECFAQDLICLLDNIGQKSAVLMGAGPVLPLCLKVAALIPDRIQAVFCHTAFAPPALMKDYQTGPGWVANMRHLTFGQNADLGDALAGAVFRLTTRIGIEECARLALTSDTASREALARPDSLDALRDAYASSVAQGVEFNTHMLGASLLEDWDNDLKACPVPVRFVIGENDAAGPAKAIEALAAACPETASYTAVAGATALYPLTHHKVFFQELSDLVGEVPDPA